MRPQQLLTAASHPRSGATLRSAALVALCGAALSACARDATAPQPATQTAAAASRDSGGQMRDESNHTGGQFLIADQFNNRVIVVTPSGQIVWHFGGGPDNVGPTAIIGVNDAERIGGGLTLMAGTGAPPGTEPACPSGCADNRVILVNRAGQIVWQYGQFGVTGAGPNQLSSPVQSTFLPGGDVLITDQGNQRVIEVTPGKQIVWQYGTTGASGAGPDSLDDPNSAELLANGHILIADENNDRAIEVTRAHQIVATFTAGGTVSGVAFASRLPNGHTLITDSNNSRAVEVDAGDHIVWQYVTNTQPGSNSQPLPTRAVRLRNGNTLISDQFNHRVIEVTPGGAIALSFGNLNVAGFGTSNAKQGLNGPYDAKVIGDFTGLTPPGATGDGENEQGD